MLQRNGFVILAMACVLLAGLAGCAAPTAPALRFYSLTPAEVPAGYAGASVLGVGPVELPDYLEQEQMVLRRGSNEIRYLDGDQWAGGLKDQLESVLAENLSVLLGGVRVLRYPWRASMGVERQASVRVLRFEGTDAGEAVLDARWTVQDSSGAILATGRTTARHSMASQDPRDLAQALSRTVQTLAKDLAEVLKDNF